VTTPDAAPHPGAVLGLLADEGRLRVLAAVALGAGSEDAVTEAVGLDRRLVRGALDRPLVWWSRRTTAVSAWRWSPSAWPLAELLTCARRSRQKM
jgi:hypothetical protein